MAVITDPADAIPKEIISFLEKIDSLKPGKLWAEKAASLVEKIPAALFGDFLDSLDLGTPLASGIIPMRLIDPKSATSIGTKAAKGGSATRPTLTTLHSAILKEKIGRDELDELLERLRRCLCCCHCWPCRQWPFCKFCRRCSVWVSTPAVGGLANHIHFTDATATLVNRRADVTCGGVAVGPWAPKTWDASTSIADAPTGYAKAAHKHDADYAPFSGSDQYSAIDHDHNDDYAPLTDSDQYSAMDHDHDDAYAPLSGSDNYAAASHVHKKTQAGRLETPASVGGGPANIKVSATAFGKKIVAPITHFPMYVTECVIGGDATLATVTLTIQHADGTAYNPASITDWGGNAKMILSYVATENQ